MTPRPPHCCRSCAINWNRELLSITIIVWKVVRWRLWIVEDQDGVKTGRSIGLGMWSLSFYESVRSSSTSMSAEFFFYCIINHKHILTKYDNHQAHIAHTLIQINRNSIRKNVFCSKLIQVKSFTVQNDAYYWRRVL